MSSADLMILGFIMHKEMSAYDMVKEFETWNIQYWIKVSVPSIYKNIIKLGEKGYLDTRVVKEGEMPEKTIYSINDKGKEYFIELMKNYASNIAPVYFNFNTFIINLHLLQESQREELLAEFNKNAAEHKKHLELVTEASGHKPYDALVLLNFYKKLFGFINEWSEELMKNYPKNK